MRKLIMILGLLGLVEITYANTLLKYYRPYGETVDQVRPRVSQIIKGSCSGQSQRIVREDAWRCLALGVVYDPCFVSSAGAKTEVICPKAPWIAESVQIELGAPLNNDNHTPLDMSRTYPWGIALANGELCQAVDPIDVYDGMPVRYRCGENHYLVGHLQRCQSDWHILEKNEHGAVLVDLKQAWF